METTGPPSRLPHLSARLLTYWWREIAPVSSGITSLLRNLGGGEEFRVVGGVGAGDELRQQIFRDPQVAGGQSFL